jgi:hypothetical protein
MARSFFRTALWLMIAIAAASALHVDRPTCREGNDMMAGSGYFDSLHITKQAERQTDGSACSFQEHGVGEAGNASVRSGYVVCGGRSMLRGYQGTSHPTRVSLFSLSNKFEGFRTAQTLARASVDQ